jgi:hypothetical protein
VSADALSREDCQGGDSRIDHEARGVLDARRLHTSRVSGWEHDQLRLGRVSRNAGLERVHG